MRKYWAFNCTRQTLLAAELELADTGWARMKGLLGRSAGEFKPGNGLWILPSQGIHTIGMTFPIDVIYLDAGCRVMWACASLRPFRIAAIKRRAESVIELPAGTLLRSQTEVGDLMQIIALEDQRSAKCAVGA